MKKKIRKIKAKAVSKIKKTRATIVRVFAVVVLIAFAVLFAVRFGGPVFLKLYIESGIGNCKKIPILCYVPDAKEIVNPEIDKEYLAKSVIFKLPGVEITLPKEYMVVKEKVNKVYYKKMKHKCSGAIAYILYERPDFFVNLFPQARQEGIKNDYEFLSRTMSATIPSIKNITDTFFVIIKSFFIPDLGDQNTVKMIKFTMPDRKGFINYNISGPDNFFDCNMVLNSGDFFKVYIKDKGAKLTLENVFSSISTLKKTKDTVKLPVTPSSETCN